MQASSYDYTFSEVLRFEDYLAQAREDARFALTDYEQQREHNEKPDFWHRIGFSRGKSPCGDKQKPAAI